MFCSRELKLDSWQLVSLRKKNSFRGNSFRGVKKNSFRGNSFRGKKKPFRGNSFRGGKNKLVSWQLVSWQKKKNSFRGIAAALTTSFVIAEHCIFLQISTLIFHLVYRHILTFWSQETPYWTKIRYFKWFSVLQDRGGRGEILGGWEEGVVLPWRRGGGRLPWLPEGDSWVVDSFFFSVKRTSKYSYYLLCPIYPQRAACSDQGWSRG